LFLNDRDQKMLKKDLFYISSPQPSPAGEGARDVPTYCYLSTINLCRYLCLEGEGWVEGEIDRKNFCNG